MDEIHSSFVILSSLSRLQSESGLGSVSGLSLEHLMDRKMCLAQSFFSTYRAISGTRTAPCPKLSAPSNRLRSLASTCCEFP